MGGRGSGAGQNGRNTTAGLAALDVRRLQRARLLSEGLTSNCKWESAGKTVAAIEITAWADHVDLSYRYRINGGNPQTMFYRVDLVSTVCHYGGRRLWFKCPANGCGKRVALLHLGGSGIFACRACYNLVYSSQRQTVGARAKARAEIIRGRLGWRGSIAAPDGDKPKGMHWLTFNRLREAHDAYIEVAVAEAMKKFGRNCKTLR